MAVGAGDINAGVGLRKLLRRGSSVGVQHALCRSGGMRIGVINTRDGRSGAGAAVSRGSDTLDDGLLSALC